MDMDTSKSERYLKMSDLQKEAEKRYPLWGFFAQEHGLALTEGQLDDIIFAVKKHLANETSKDHGESSPLEGIVRLQKVDLVVDTCPKCDPTTYANQKTTVSANCGCMNCGNEFAT